MRRFAYMKWERSVLGRKDVGDISVLVRERYILTAISVAGLADGGIISGFPFCTACYYFVDLFMINNHTMVQTISDGLMA